ncbi:WD repeat-containing protein 36-like isoform X2 [Ruditapes philippinarum]|uniref:WD repeat-containing protein 36-like isoform X2 n=1 Tax=Ruditapes philippinarum TaxID=129788 RepID=UPI00295C29CC|nr:WD repeat-containing protein 36-like isoform X2 [Ruditapes philippinarum]
MFNVIMPAPSKIFTGYRALGFVSNHVPLAVRYHQKHKENYVVTCVGKCFHTYNCSKLGIVSVSDSHPEDISVLAVDRDLTFTACRNVIRAFTRGRQVIHVYEGHTADVHLLLPFGNHLISVDVDSSVIVWDIKSQGQYSEIQFNKTSFEITTVTHPSTYLNKILFGSKQGRLELWNIKKNTMIYSFKGWGQPVTVVEQAPAVDVVAIGLANGQIIIHNLKFDETITKFLQDWGPVTTISFRTDGHPIMATGSATGHIALWDLEERKLRSQMREAHMTSVSGMQCLPSEPLMVTSSADNTLKVWIFDLPDGGGRLLRNRSGHSAPSTKLRHYGTDGQNIVTAGQDSTMRSFSTVHDKHHKSLGRASYNKQLSKKNTLKYDEHKMPYIVDFATEQTRQSDWDNILACHRGLRVVTTWNYVKSTMGQHKFDHKRFTKNAAQHMHTVAQCVEITSCGNFGLIGYSSGHIDVYNLQSGIHRGSFEDHSGEQAGIKQAKAHNSHVQGVVVDGLNQLAISAGREGDIKFWKFKDKKLLDTCKLDSTVSKILLHRESSMMAVARDDFHVYIIDIDTRKVVRKFIGHDNRITDMTFSADARWLITAAMDCTLRVWDLPTGRLVDCFLVDSAVMSLSMSPNYDFLATCHLDDVGIYLWANKTLFSHVPLTALPSNYEPQMIEMPTTRKHTAEDVDEDIKEEEEEFIRAEFKSSEQISHELITLSLLPNSRWQNLLNLDVIKQRNKPREPPKAPKAAPFFLPTVAGLEPKFAVDDEGAGEGRNKGKVQAGNLMPLCTLGQLLKEGSSKSNYDKVTEYMKSLGPSAVDVEIRSLAPEMGGSVVVMCNFLQFVQSVLQTNKNFEIIQAYLGLFLKVHSEILSSEPEVVKELEKLSDLQSTSWCTVQDLFNQTLCLVNYLRTAVL